MHTKTQNGFTSCIYLIIYSLVQFQIASFVRIKLVYLKICKIHSQFSVEIL